MRSKPRRGGIIFDKIIPPLRGLMVIYRFYFPGAALRSLTLLRYGPRLLYFAPLGLSSVRVALKRRPALLHFGELVGVQRVAFERALDLDLQAAARVRALERLLGELVAVGVELVGLVAGDDRVAALLAAGHQGAGGRVLFGLVLRGVRPGAHVVNDVARHLEGLLLVLRVSEDGCEREGQAEEGNLANHLSLL